MLAGEVHLPRLLRDHRPRHDLRGRGRLRRSSATTMASARGLNAAVHVAIVLIVFATCRRLGVRRELAAPVAVAHLALATLFLPISARTG